MRPIMAYINDKEMKEVCKLLRETFYDRSYSQKYVPPSFKGRITNPRLRLI